MKTQLIQTRSTPVAPYRQGARAEVTEPFQLKKEPVTKDPIRDPLKRIDSAERLMPSESPRSRGIERPGGKPRAATESVSAPSQQKPELKEALVSTPKDSERAVSTTDSRQGLKSVKKASDSNQELVAEGPSKASEDAQALFVPADQREALAENPTIAVGSTANPSLDSLLEGTADATVVIAESMTMDSLQVKGTKGSMQMAIEAISSQLEGAKASNPELEGKFEALLSKLEALATSHEAKQQTTPNGDKMKLDKMLSAYGAELVQLTNGTAGGPKLTAQRSEALQSTPSPLTTELPGPTDLLMDLASMGAESEASNQELLGKQLEAALNQHDAKAEQVDDTSLFAALDAATESASPSVTNTATLAAGSEVRSENTEPVQQGQKAPEEAKVQEHRASQSQDVSKVGGVVDLSQQNQPVHEIKDKSIMQHKISPSAIMEQVREAILKAPLQQGERSEMVLQLKPEELGKVELKIEVHKDVVIAKFDVASAMVKETIESNLADLKSSLKDKGFSDMTFDVNVSKERTHEGHSGHSGNGRRKGRSIQALEGLSQQQAGYTQSSLAKLVGNSQFEHYA